MDKKTIVATRELNHGREFVSIGQELECSDADAHYYVSRHLATYSTRELTAQAPTPPPPPMRATLRARPPAARAASASVGPMTTGSAQALVPSTEAPARAGNTATGKSPNDDAIEEQADADAAARESDRPLQE